MRAEQWMLVGIVGIGAYAVWRLTQTTSADQPSAPPDQNPIIHPPVPFPTPVVIPAGALSNLPGVLPAPPANMVLETGPTLNLQPAAEYHGRLETISAGGHESAPPFSSTSAQADIENALKAMFGFNIVHVFMTPQAAAQDLFNAYSLSTPGRGTRWFRARFPFVMDNPPNPKPVRPTELVLFGKTAPLQQPPVTAGFYNPRTDRGRYGYDDFVPGRGYLRHALTSHFPVRHQ